MTPEAQMALISAIIPTITSIGVILVTLHAKNVAKTDADEKNKVSDSKLNHITELTNSTLTAANKRIELLEELVRKLLKEKSAVSTSELAPPPTVSDITGTIEGTVVNKK